MHNTKNNKKKGKAFVSWIFFLSNKTKFDFVTKGQHATSDL